MGPIIISDKSAIQSFSIEELVIFHKYYMPNIVPVLILEILGDLKKNYKNGLTEQQSVQQLANKLLPFDNAFNSFHLTLINGELMGAYVQMDGRPILNEGRSVKTDDGKRGIIFEESPEETALTRWRGGQFNEAESAMAERWKEFSKKQDLVSMKLWIEKWIGEIPKFKNLDDVYKFIEKIINTKNQSGLLAFIISQFGLDQSGPEIFYRWTRKGSPKILDFTPYTIHCFKVNIFCYLGMISGLLGTRTTNSVDMQYLYYLPFAMIFCSNDKFHHDIIKYFLTEEQYFIKGTDLKNELKDLLQLSRKDI